MSAFDKRGEERQRERERERELRTCETKYLKAIFRSAIERPSIIDLECPAIIFIITLKRFFRAQPNAFQRFQFHLGAFNCRNQFKSQLNALKATTQRQQKTKQKFQ